MKQLGLLFLSAFASLLLLFLDLPYPQQVSPEFLPILRYVSPGVFLNALLGCAGVSYVLSNIKDDQANVVIRLLRQFAPLRLLLLPAIGFSLGAAVCDGIKSGEYSVGAVFWLSHLSGFAGLFVGSEAWFVVLLNRTSAWLARIRPLLFWVAATLAILSGQMIGAGIFWNTPSRWLSLIGLNLAFALFGILILLLVSWRYPNAGAFDEQATPPQEN